MAEVRWGAFIPALILAPLVLCLPALAGFALLYLLGATDNVFALILAVVSFAAATGAPTYLTFGAFAFHAALRRGIPLWTAAIAANVISAPVVLIAFRLLGTGWGDALGATVYLIIFGCIFAPLWGVIFEALYDLFVRIGDGLRARADVAQPAEKEPSGMVLQPRASARQH